MSRLQRPVFDGGRRRSPFGLLLFGRDRRVFVNMVDFHRSPDGLPRRLIFADRTCILETGADHVLVRSSGQLGCSGEDPGIDRRKRQPAIESPPMHGELRRRIGARRRRAILGESAHSAYRRSIFQIMAESLAERDRSPQLGGANHA